MTLEERSQAARATAAVGRVVALHVVPGPRSRSTPTAVTSVTALEGHGLQGDRHARAGNLRSVLLVEAEVVDGLGLEPGVIREQVIVRGIALDALAAGTRLSAGTAVLEVGEPCDPCERMEEIRPGLRVALEGRRGRFVQVVQGGTFAVGDSITVSGS